MEISRRSNGEFMGIESEPHGISSEPPRECFTKKEQTASVKAARDVCGGLAGQFH